MGVEQMGSPWRGNFRYDSLPVITVAPDAYIFINGEPIVKVCRECNASVDVHDSVTTISTSLGINTAGGGSSQISLKIPAHDRHNLVRNGEAAISPMSEIEVWMKGFFMVDGVPRYYPVFWGLISSTTYDYSDGYHNLNIDCKDILYWWQLSNFNYAASAIGQWLNPASKSTGFASVFKESSPFAILYMLSLVSMQEAVVPDVSVNAEYTGAALELFESGNKELIEYWKTRFSQLTTSIRIFDITGQNVNKPLELVTEGKSESYSKMLNEAFTTTRVFGVSFDDPEIVKLRESLNQASATDALAIQAKIDELRKTGKDRDFMLSTTIQGPSLVSSEYRTKLDIMNQVKDFMGWEFYMDVTGEIIFKPPYYNMDVRGNPVQVIKNEHLIDFNRTEGEPEATQIFVTGNLHHLVEGEAEIKPFGWYTDFKLAKTFGIRSTTKQVDWARNSVECTYAAMNEISKYDVMRRTMSVTIPLRPELRLGFPVYIEPFDEYWYVESINHAFTFGGNATTSLSLIAGRGRYKNIVMKGKTDGRGKDINANGTVVDYTAVTRSKEHPSPAGRKIDLGIANTVMVWSPYANVEIDDPQKSIDLMKNPEKIAELADAQKKRDDEDEAKKNAATKSSAAEQKAPNKAGKKGKGKTGAQPEVEKRATATTQDSLMYGRSRLATRADITRDLKNIIDGTKVGNAFGVWSPTIDRNKVTAIFDSDKKVRPLTIEKLSTVIPVSDDEGYELVGLFPYGRGISVTENGGLSVNATEAAAKGQSDAIRTLLNLSPFENEKIEQQSAARGEDQAGIFQTTSINVGVVLAELTPKGTQAGASPCTCSLESSDFDVQNVTVQKKLDQDPDAGVVGIQFDRQAVSKQRALEGRLVTYETSFLEGIDRKITEFGNSVLTYDRDLGIELEETV